MPLICYSKCTLNIFTLNSLSLLLKICAYNSDDDSGESCAGETRRSETSPPTKHLGISKWKLVVWTATRMATNIPAPLTFYRKWHLKSQLNSPPIHHLLKHWKWMSQLMFNYLIPFHQMCAQSTSLVKLRFGTKSFGTKVLYKHTRLRHDDVTVPIWRAALKRFQPSVSNQLKEWKLGDWLVSIVQWKTLHLPCMTLHTR